jgi:hypothetical protein
MVYPDSLKDREQAKFVNSSGETAIRISPSTGFLLPKYNEIVINYTDATKSTISTVVYKLNSSTVATLTLTPATTTDTWVRS